MKRQIIRILSLVFVLSQAAPKLLPQQIPDELNLSREMSIILERANNSIEECEIFFKNKALVNVSSWLRGIKKMGDDIKSFLEEYNEMVARIRNSDNAEEAYATACDLMKNAQERFDKHLEKHRLVGHPLIIQVTQVSVEERIREAVEDKDRARAIIAQKPSFFDIFWQSKEIIDPEFYWRAWDAQIQGYQNLKSLFSVLGEMKTSLDSEWIKEVSNAITSRE